MSSRVGEIHLGPRVVQPQSFLGRGQLVSLEETLEEHVTPLPQVRQATVGHPHPRTIAPLAVRPHQHFDPILGVTEYPGLPAEQGTFHPPRRDIRGRRRVLVEESGSIVAKPCCTTVVDQPVRTATARAVLTMCARTMCPGVAQLRSRAGPGRNQPIADGQSLTDGPAAIVLT